MQFWKQDMVQSVVTESKEEAEQLLVRNNCKLSSVHLKQLRYQFNLIIFIFTHFLPHFTNFSPDSTHFYPQFTLSFSIQM